MKRIEIAIFIAAGLFAAASPGYAAKKQPRDAPPELIIDSGPRWKNIAELRRAAEADDSQAAFELGERLMEGDGVPRDFAEARRWFEKAAEAGVPNAWFRLGKIHHDGLMVPQDYAKGFEYYTEAAKRGVPEAQHNVGAMLVSARGVKRDYVEGLAWLIVAGKAGAASEAERQVRERLARRPGDVAKAETRAAELLAAMNQPSGAPAPRAKVESPPATNAPLPRPVIDAPTKVEIGVPGVVAPRPPPVVIDPRKS